MTILREESFNKKNDLEKEKLFSYEKIGQYQLIKRVYVKNFLENHTTEIIFSDMVIDTGMSDKLFNEMSLRRLPLECSVSKGLTFFQHMFDSVLGQFFTS